MADNSVVLAGKKLRSIDLSGWRKLHGNPVPDKKGVVDLYFTAPAIYLERLRDLKGSMASDEAVRSVSFLSSQSHEFSAFSSLPAILDVREKGDTAVYEEIADRNFQKFLGLQKTLQLPFVEKFFPDGNFGRVINFLDAAGEVTKGDFVALEEIRGPLLDRMVLKASVLRENLDGVLIRQFSTEMDPTVLEKFTASRPSIVSAIKQWVGFRAA